MTGQRPIVIQLALPDVLCSFLEGHSVGEKDRGVSGVRPQRREARYARLGTIPVVVMENGVSVRREARDAQ